MVKRIESLVEKYNKLAAERNMTSMPYPSYGNIEVVSKSILLKDLSTMKDAVEKLEDIEVESEKVVRNAKFVKDANGEDVYDNGMWRYALIFNGNALSVRYIGDKTVLNLTYDNMPFERIYTKDGPDNGYPIVYYSGAFFERAITSITISGWTNRNVKYMAGMFHGCSKLSTLNLSNFDTNQVIHMAGMFQDCSSLKTLNLSSFDTSNVTVMSDMFYGCSSLTELNLSDWDTSSVTDADAMFFNCNVLKTIITNGADITDIVRREFPPSAT